MNVPSSPATQGDGFFRRFLFFFNRETGQLLLPWAIVALLNFALQIVFRRELAPGEFGTLNTVLGVVGLVIVPVVAVQRAFILYQMQPHTVARQNHLDAIRAAAPRIMQTVLLIWGVISIPLLFVFLPLFNLPRFSLQFFTFLFVLVSLGGLASESICEDKKSMRLWNGLLIGVALARVIFGASLTQWEPWADAGLAVFVLAGFITLIPIFRQHEIEFATMKEWKVLFLYDQHFLRWLGATLSVVMGLFLFSSADRITAQSWFGSADNNNMGYVDWSIFDGYQTAGLLGRALLWGTQPLLLILFIQRAGADRTTGASLKFLWIYIGTLVVGAVLLSLFGQRLSWLFCGGDSFATYRLIPMFAVVMTLLGVLQGVGVFALASRRYPECFVFGAASIGYMIILYLAGRHPDLMLTYMFGGGLVALLSVLFIGIVRWGRKQP